MLKSEESVFTKINKKKSSMAVVDESSMSTNLFPRRTAIGYRMRRDQANRLSQGSIIKKMGSVEETTGLRD